jgi:hypothetical protein
VGTSEPLFIVGATLAYVGRLQAQIQAIHAHSPAEGERIRKKLAAIALPSQYRIRPGVPRWRVTPER